MLDAGNGGAAGIGAHCKSNRKTRACPTKKEGAPIPDIQQKKFANLLDLSVIFVTLGTPGFRGKRKMGGSPIFCL
jgi:hypothetical protein